jgi:predicted dehydrogenase
MAGIGIGLVGTGFMGKCHALAYRAAGAVFGDVPHPRLEMLCETPADKAAAMAVQFGFARSTGDWSALVADPAVDVVCITTPNKLHAEMALAAIAAGKHVHCEKPLALTLADAETMAAAAGARGVKTMVGYNYTHNPAFTHARRLVEAGVIGRVVHFRGWVDEDYQADGDMPWTWRATAAEAGLGALGDLGCHLVSMTLGLAGPVESLTADMQTIHATRAMPDGSGRGRVENEDVATALVRFATGAQGSLSASRSAWGRKSRIAWEVHGTTGMLTYDQERRNELCLSRSAGDPALLGFNELQVIEVACFLREIAGGPAVGPDFARALEIERVIHAIAEAARSDRRVRL